MATVLEFQLNITGPETEQLFVIPQGTTRIGRVPANNEIVLVHHFVSSRHAQLIATPSGCQLTDLGSTNGTLVNGKKATPNAPIPLNNGTVIQIGPYRLTYQIIETTELEPTPPPPPPPPPQVKIEPPLPIQPIIPDNPPPIIPPIYEPPPPPPPPPSKGISLHPATPPPGLTQHSQRLINYLPGVYHTDFMSRFLAIFEAILTPIEWTIDHFDLYLSPMTAPIDFLGWLARWYSISFDFSWSERQQRTFLAEAHLLYAHRGTRWALSRTLEIYVGQKPQILDLEDEDEPFIFTVKLPVSAREVNRAVVEELINSHKPAHTSYRLLFRDSKS